MIDIPEYSGNQTEVTIHDFLEEDSIEDCIKNNKNFLPDGGGHFCEITDEKVERWAEIYKASLSEILD